MIEFVIPDCAPSPNRVLRMHWSAQKKLRDLWHKWVWVACVQGKIPMHMPLAFAHIQIERRGRKAMDPDNLMGAQKPLIDGLRIHGLIEDDDDKHVTVKVTQSLGEPRTIVRIR